MAQKRRKKNRVRQKDWATDANTTFSHDLRKHRRTDTVITQSASISEVPDDFEPNGLVHSHSKKWAFVQRDGEEEVTTCRISPQLGDGRSTIVAAGDRVLVDDLEEGPTVIAVAPRRSKLSRLAIEHSHVDEQVFAANIDILVIVVSVQKPVIKQGLIDRYLIAADAGYVSPVLCVNKIDLMDEEPEMIQFYRDIDIPVLMTSCETGEGLDALRDVLAKKWAVFAGHSGVGKSTLLNCLSPELNLDTREVSRRNEKGKHTTTLSQLHVLEGDIHVVDTPGIRQLGLWNVSPEEVSYYFPEIAELGAGCKFRDCTHIHEPDCAVRGALEEGRLNAYRYDSYVRIRGDLDESAADYKKRS
ncbi:MAG: ribosome small subunit-dependent GTPase A [Candidatus Hydrogenedentota bacterium]